MVETEVARFGSEKTGLLCGYRFRPGEIGREVDADEVADLLRDRADQESGTFYWLHFNLANQASQRWIAHRLALPEGFDPSLPHAMSTRVEIDGRAIVAVLNDVRLFGLDASEVATMVLCVDERLIVSGRQSPLRTIDRLRASAKNGETFRSPVEMLAHLLRYQADVLVQIVRDATTHVDKVEDRLLAHQVSATRSKLGAQRRMLVRLQRLLAPEPAALFRLLNRPPVWMSTSDVNDLRLSAEELAAAVADCAALIERVRLLQEEVFAFVNEQTSRTLFVLTVVTVMALPMTIIPGLFGMNIGGIPLHDASAGFWIVALVTVALPTIGIMLALRARRER